ncbi:metalloregulator ArsR/SmtB family transcription factor [Heliobacterium gestii]|uniref:Metalloregulator ArsR/SmtB family transcription factor n=1 Tax=Heliomicrobium gestii TaxID=2699 RepID=A0A845LBI2_HELGE|nr:metalloregulator ArsR/SmtB family transcription factor [Heliomicrobium gestii]MBM7866276.1 ArsR family transcriptional regulator [Heliomicrobium gestii]MZP42931.1 metalloregulator ArsR/SmtB family transcription factor [Heliomicrobium gestii]
MENDIRQYTKAAELLKALAHPVRLCILQGLMQKGDCNVSHMQHCLELPQSTISMHLQKLRVAGVVEGERQGLEVRYRIANDQVRSLLSCIFVSEI